MKTMYKCEKCGKLFDNYDDANKCENFHLTPDDLTLPDSCHDAYELTYSEGGALPDFVTVRFPIPNDDGWGYKKNENDEYMYRYEKYVRSKHTDTASQNWDEAIHKGVAEKKAEDDKWWADYHAAQEAKRKAEEKVQEAQEATENNEEE